MFVIPASKINPFHTNLNLKYRKRQVSQGPGATSSEYSQHSAWVDCSYINDLTGQSNPHFFDVTLVHISHFDPDLLGMTSKIQGLTPLCRRV